MNPMMKYAPIALLLGAAGLAQAQQGDVKQLGTTLTPWGAIVAGNADGTLKEGKRHIFKQRDMYIDEDSWGDGMADEYDHNGKLFHVNIQIGLPLYDAPAPAATDNMVIDMISGVYGWSGAWDGFYLTEAWPRAKFAPDLLVNKKILLKQAKSDRYASGQGA